jgi:2-polyprenyl-3-methyl-5-hydroxy-6-metoxy-1,4-benzoquinol methylase
VRLRPGSRQRRAHASDSQRMLAPHQLTPRTITEVGCGAGEILWQFQQNIQAGCTFHGYDISPQAIALAKEHENELLHFTIADIRKEANTDTDLLLVMDVLEHIEDRLVFLRAIKPKAEYKLFHVSLNISVQTILRKNGVLRGHELYGMVNYFTKEVLLQTLRDADYEILGCSYTTGSTDLPLQELKRNLMRIPRKMLFTLNQDLAVRILGGYRTK